MQLITLLLEHVFHSTRSLHNFQGTGIRIYIYNFLRLHVDGIYHNEMKLFCKRIIDNSVE